MLSESNTTLFAQVIRLIPREIIQRLVKKHSTDKYAKGFISWSHLVTMIFSQFSGSVSLRQISEGLQICHGQSQSSRSITSSLSTSQNTVEIQIWTALITILLPQYFKRNRPLSVDQRAVFTASRRARNSIGGIPPFLPQMSRGD